MADRLQSAQRRQAGKSQFASGKWAPPTCLEASVFNLKGSGPVRLDQGALPPTVGYPLFAPGWHPAAGGSGSACAAPGGAARVNLLGSNCV